MEGASGSGYPRLNSWGNQPSHFTAQPTTPPGSPKSNGGGPPSVDPQAMASTVQQAVSTVYEQYVEPETQNVFYAWLNRIVSRLYTPCADKTLVSFSYTVGGHTFHLLNFHLPEKAKSAPLWVLNVLRVYWLFYRSHTSLKSVGIGFAAGMAVSAGVPRVLEAFNAKRYVAYDKIFTPGLLHLIDLGIFGFTLISASSTSASALGYQLSTQAATWTRG